MNAAHEEQKTLLMIDEFIIRAREVAARLSNPAMFTSVVSTKVANMWADPALMLLVSQGDSLVLEDDDERFDAGEFPDSDPASATTVVSNPADPISVAIDPAVPSSDECPLSVDSRPDLNDIIDDLGNLW